MLSRRLTCPSVVSVMVVDTLTICVVVDRSFKLVVWINNRKLLKCSTPSFDH